MPLVSKWSGNCMVLDSNRYSWIVKYVLKFQVLNTIRKSTKTDFIRLLNLKANSDRHSLLHAGFVANVYVWCVCCHAHFENEEFWPQCHCCSNVVFKIIEIDHSTSHRVQRIVWQKSELSASVLSFYQFSRNFPNLFREWPRTKGLFPKFQKKAEQNLYKQQC